MKTTIDLPEDLLAEARLVAERKGWTVRAVFEESLRAFFEQQESSQKPFRLAHTVVHGEAPPAMTFGEMLEATELNRFHR